MCGYRRGYRYWWRQPPTIPPGYIYTGPCRCGFGPHAFYRDPSGRIIHAWGPWGWEIPPAPTEEDLKAELAALKNEKEELEKRIAELEKQIKAEEK